MKTIGGGLDISDVATWPWWQKALACFGTVAWVLAAGYWLVLGDQRRELARLGQAGSDSRLALEAKQDAQGGAATVHQRHGDLETTLALALRQLPTTTDVPALIDDLGGAAVDSGLVIDSIQVAEETVYELHAALPITLVLAGTYHQFGAFLAAAAALDPVVAFQDFEIEARGTGLILNLAARAYRAVDGPHRAVASGDSASGSPGVAGVAYEGTGRSPFEADRPPPSAPLAEAPAEEALESFALGRLRMVGVLARRGDSWGLVRDPGGHVHRVGIGDRLGLQGGRVTRVEFDAMEVTETLADEGGGWTKRVRRLEPVPPEAPMDEEEPQDKPVDEDLKEQR